MLLLPTCKPSEKFIDLIQIEEKSEAKFINGYRNCLTKDLQWILIKQDKFCGQVYCYPLKQDEEIKKKLASYERQFQKIQIIQGNYILVSNQERRFNHSQPIDGEKVKELMDLIGGPNVGRNILINSFVNFQDFKKAGWLQLSRNSQKIESMSKEYSEKRLLEVPYYNQQSGDWNYEKTIPLKLATQPKEKNVAEEVIEIS